MNVAKAAWFVVVFLLLVALHYSLRPLLAWRGGVDFLMIALLLVAVRARPGVAAIAGLVLGLVSDSLTPVAFGAGALAMSVVGFGASWLKAAFFADNVALNGMFVFLGKWAFDLLFLAGEHRLQGTDFLLQAMLWSPLAAAATAVVGLIVLLAVRPVLGAPRA
ncbi:MAG: rod shape-determining protein MreD [Gemmatimonadetes bacterium]|nr:rod shape-determining protein MreD [Gemmatimonadota bacterium]MBI3567133.1 rod shape-determining protein MreD [Gemmatimonadota bacterium]